MANPLYVLRDFVMSGRLAEVKEEEVKPAGDGGGAPYTEVVFGNVLRCRADAKTCYKDKSQGDWVTVVSAYLLAKNKMRYQYIAEMAKVRLIG